MVVVDLRKKIIFCERFGCVKVNGKWWILKYLLTLFMHQCEARCVCVKSSRREWDCLINVNDKEIDKNLH